jgi:hypothetical protein
LSSRLVSKNVKIRIHKPIILPVVLFGCEAWSLILREERGLGVFQNGVLRMIFGQKREKVTGEWRKLHNEELSYFFSSPRMIRIIKSRWMTLVGECSTNGVKKTHIGY